jgi:hypothetical protein
MTNIVKIADLGHVRTITLNRPEKKNALSDALAWGVIAAVEDAARTDDVWVPRKSDRPFRLSSARTSKGHPRRSGLQIRGVRNRVAESTVCWGLGLDLDGSI